MGTSRARVALLAYLSASQHILDAARAAPDAQGATSEPEGSFGPPMAGASTSSALLAPLSTTAPVPQPSIPRHQAKKVWKGFKEAVVKKSKCPVPDGQSTEEVCGWFACKIDHHKKKLEQRKTVMEDEYKQQSRLKAWLAKRRDERTGEDYLLSNSKTRRMYYNVVKYVLLQYDRECDTEQDAFDDLRAWTKTIFPERYECIFKVVDEYLSTHENCDERFTHTFEEDMFQQCKNKDFYKEDLQPTTGELAGPQVTAAKSKANQPHWKAAARGAAGILVSGVIFLSGMDAVDFLFFQVMGMSSMIGGWAIMFGFFALAAGILAASIAFLVCKYLPKKKRAGVRASKVVGEDASSSLK